MFGRVVDPATAKLAPLLKSEPSASRYGLRYLVGRLSPDHFKHRESRWEKNLNSKYYILIAGLNYKKERKEKSKNYINFKV